VDLTDQHAAHFDFGVAARVGADVVENRAADEDLVAVLPALHRGRHFPHGNFVDGDEIGVALGRLRPCRIAVDDDVVFRYAHSSPSLSASGPRTAVASPPSSNPTASTPFRAMTMSNAGTPIWASGRSRKSSLPTIL